ncbi:MAG TPA: M48 family metallopeptidase [Terriglobales bacterium]|nr:M48 family metallopeptidase [Terriglobales bacterium]
MQRVEPKEGYEYDPGKRALAASYEKLKLLLGFVDGTLVPIAFCLILLLSGASVNLSRLLGSLTNSYWISLGLYLATFTILLQIIEAPFSYYSGFIVDHRFKLSTQTIKGWLMDEVKGLGVEVLFAVFAGTILYYLIQATALWWIVAAVIFAAFSIFISTILPYVILPIFYKVTPVKDDQLRAELVSMSEKMGVKNVNRILVADESSKSVRANAFFSGVGDSKAIVLFDTLLNNFTRREIITVVAHELGHYVNKDIWKEAVTSGLFMILPFFIADYALRFGASSLGLTGVSDPAGIPLIITTLIGISFTLQPLTNAISRYVERKADEFGLLAAEDPVAQASAERRLTDLSLSVDTPSRIVELFFYTHPPSSKRIELAEQWKKTEPTQGFR